MANFTSKNEGTWFYFDINDESLGGVKLRLLSPKEEDNIERLTVKKKQVPKRGMIMEVKTTDEKMKNRMTYDGWIMDWSDISLDGSTMSCTTENKIKMMEITDFARFVVDSVLTLTETNKTIDEARVKNLEISSGGRKQNQTVNDA